MKRLMQPALAGFAALALTVGVACSARTDNATSETATVPSTSFTSSTDSNQSSSTSFQTAASTSGDLSVADVVKLAGPSVVRIQTSTGIGSGFVIAGDGYIMTNNHVVEGATRSITVTLSDGAQYSATIAGTDPRSDLALLKIEATGLSALKVAKLDTIEVGQDVVAIGYALDLNGGEGAGFTVTTGIVSAKNRGIEENSTILGAVQTDAAINHGNSGGPLLNRKGELVGVNTATAPGDSVNGSASGIAFAVGSDTVQAVYDALRADGQVNRGVLGIASFTALRPAQAAELGIPSGVGGVVLGTPNAVPTTSRTAPAAVSGAAASAGLRSGDVITKIGDLAISDESDLAIALIKYRAGQTVTVTFYRGGAQQSVSVTLGSSTS
jgi:S1-C subfamily serine protease